VARIFAVLALLAVLLLAANFAVGLWIGDFNAAARSKMDAGNRLADVQRRLAANRISSSAELDMAREGYLAADQGFQTPRNRMTIHMLLGASSSLLAILVNSITITYFIGTSRWCKEVCHTYHLPTDLAERSTRLKRSTFPWALAGILSLIGIVGLGAAADPSGANSEHSASFVNIHYLAAMIGLFIVIVAFWVQISRIAANYAVIEEILTEVNKIRTAAEKKAAKEGWAEP
jgi:hypothetical protein